MSKKGRHTGDNTGCAQAQTIRKATHYHHGSLTPCLTPHLFSRYAMMTLVIGVATRLVKHTPIIDYTFSATWGSVP